MVCIEASNNGWTVAVRESGKEIFRRWYPGADKTSAMRACFRQLALLTKMAKLSESVGDANMAALCKGALAGNDEALTLVLLFAAEMEES